MIIGLLLIGLAVTPFILAPGAEDLAREPKMAWALVFALSIGLAALYRGTLKPFKNKWALALVGFCLLSFYLAPKPDLTFFGVRSARFWSWEPLYQGLVFLLFTIAVSSIKLTRQKIDYILTTMVWCAGIMACFVILQFFGLDQFFEHRYGTYGRMAGTIGNPTLIGPFLCLNLPLMFYQKRKAFAILSIIAILATRSDVAAIGLILTCSIYLMLKSRKLFIYGAGLGAAIVLTVASVYITNPTFRNICPDNERFLTWTRSLATLTTPVMRDSKKIYAITGIGPGSFKYIYHTQHEKQKVETSAYAHNEYVQTTYELGIVGLILFIGLIVVILRQKGGGPAHRALMSGLIGILGCAGGIFIFQVGTHIFYTLTIVGLLCNESVCAKEEICQQ